MRAFEAANTRVKSEMGVFKGQQAGGDAGEAKVFGQMRGQVLRVVRYWFIVRILVLHGGCVEK